MPSTLFIRADGSALIGTGHVMRCLALAQAWRRSGGNVVLAQAETTPALLERIHREGVPVLQLPVKPGSDDDAAETIRQARASHAGWIVADGYCFGDSWQQKIRAQHLKLLVVDDYGHAAAYRSNLVLNQNIGATDRLYAQRDPATHLLLGTRYALLRNEFQAWRDWCREIPGTGHKVLVTFGGSDPDNVTVKAIEALDLVQAAEVVIVVGGSNPHLPAIRSAAAACRTSVRLAVNPPNLPELMAWADLALSGAGSTCWELAYMGLPAALMVLSDNQREIGAGLARAGVSCTLGESAELSTVQIAAAVTALLGDGARRREMSTRGRQLVDGHGAARVAAAMGSPLNLTLLTDADSWLNAFLPELKVGLEAHGHRVHWIHEPKALLPGDIAFLLSLSRVVPAPLLRRHAHNLVVHESALPLGRGWSPLTWQILENKREIPITLFEATENADHGDIYAHEALHFSGHELLPELRAAQAAATIRLCRHFISRYPFVCAEGRPQAGAATYYRRRQAADSQLDPDRSLREQFNLLRVADPERYPAFFEIDGRRYEVAVRHAGQVSPLAPEPTRPDPSPVPAALAEIV